MAYGDIDNQVQAYESKGIAALKQMQQSNPKLLAGIAIENLQRELESRERGDKMGAAPAGASVIDKKLGLGGSAPPSSQQALAAASPGLAMQGQRMQGQQLAQQLNNAPKPGGGLGGLAPSGQGMAGGGIVEYAEGKLVAEKPTLGAMPSSPVGDLQIKQFADQYNALKAGAAAATTPEDKAQSQQLMQELIQGMGDQHGAVMQYIDSTKGFVDPRSQMAGGGIVSLQQGGPVQKFQQGLSVEGDPLTLDSVTETGERIVALAGPNGVPVTEEEYIAFTENGQLPANRNDRRYSAPTPATPLTAEQTWLKRMDQMDQTIGPILFGETGLDADIKAVGNNPDFTWQEKVGGGYESGAEALGKLIGKTTGTAGITGEYILRSLGLGASGAGQTGVLGEGVEAAKEYVETLSEPSRSERMEAAFNERIAALSAKLNELQNTALDIDLDPGGEKRAAAIAAIQGQIDQAQAQYESTVSSNRSDLDTIKEAWGNTENQDKLKQRLGIDPSVDLTSMSGGVEGLAQYLGMQSEAEKAEEERVQEQGRRVGLDVQAAAQLERDAMMSAPRSPEERFNQLFRQPEDVAGAGQGQTSDQRQTQRIADAKTQFAIDNPEPKGIADLMGSENAQNILDIIRKLGYAGGASKGYEGQALFQGMQAERDAETKAGRDRDMLNVELEGRMKLMKEEQQMGNAARAGMELAEFSGTYLTADALMRTQEYMDEEKRLIKEKGWRYTDSEEKDVKAKMAEFLATLRTTKQAEYRGLLSSFSGLGVETPPSSPSPSPSVGETIVDYTDVAQLNPQ